MLAGTSTLVKNNESFLLCEVMCPVTRVAAVSNAIPAKISVFYKSEILSKIRVKL